MSTQNESAARGMSMQVLGCFLKASINTLEELRELGEAVLAEAQLTEIDPDTYYPAGLRRKINQAVYDRFGTPGLVWVGIDTMEYLQSIDYPLHLFDETIALDHSLAGMSDDAEREQAIHAHMIKHAEVFSGYMHHTIRGMPSHWGWRLVRIGPGDYWLENHSVGLMTQEGFGRGMMQWALRHTMPEHFDFSLDFAEDRFETREQMSIFRYRLQVRPKPPQPRHAELLAHDKLAARDALLKFALRKSIEQEKRAERALKEVEAAHQQILESIRYASLLQNAQLPGPERWQRRFRDFAALFRPRDGIGGDLWWLSPNENDGDALIALADCTGHGVPGAMLAMLVSSALERHYLSEPGTRPDGMLNALQQTINQSFGSSGGASVADGCDVVCLQINTKQRSVTAAGAGLGFLQLKARGDVERHNLGRTGLAPGPAAPLLQLASFSYEAGDRLLVYTDGLCDQPGGETPPRSLGNKRIAEWLTDARGLDAESALKKIESRFLDWQGARMRRDDVTVLCIDL